MDTVREGEKGVTRKQRSKSIDHLNQSQVRLILPIQDYEKLTSAADNHKELYL